MMWFFNKTDVPQHFISWLQTFLFFKGETSMIQDAIYPALALTLDVYLKKHIKSTFIKMNDAMQLSLLASVSIFCQHLSTSLLSFNNSSSVMPSRNMTISASVTWLRRSCRYSKETQTPRFWTLLGELVFWESR